MSHQPNWQEYGNPVVSSGEKTVVEVHDSIYGTYKEAPVPQPSGSNPAEKYNPKPFTLKST